MDLLPSPLRVKKKNKKHKAHQFPNNDFLFAVR